MGAYEKARLSVELLSARNPGNSCRGALRQLAAHQETAYTHCMQFYLSGLLGLLWLATPSWCAPLISGQFREFPYVYEWGFYAEGMVGVSIGYDMKQYPPLDSVESVRILSGYYNPSRYIDKQRVGAFFYDPSGAVTYGLKVWVDMEFLPNGQAVMDYYLLHMHDGESWDDHFSLDPPFIGRFFGSYFRYQIWSQEFTFLDEPWERGIRMNFTHGVLADGRLIGTPEPTTLVLVPFSLVVLAGLKRMRRIC